MNDPKLVRNFAIVAHVDHGKSTLADRLLELTHTIEKRNMIDQLLDSNPIERERGITIKLAPVRMNYTYNDKKYVLNLIDTPGHVDFSYEVSRSLAACEGIILVVDATCGIQAQTVAHMNLIKQNKLQVIPVVNKIDLENANPQKTINDLVDSFNFKPADIIQISAKSGLNTEKVLASVIERIPAPTGNNDILRGLVFSSYYDAHHGVVVYVRLTDGQINLKDFRKNKKLKFYASNEEFHPVDIGIFTPAKESRETLNFGDVGYIATGLKNLSLAQIGDTVFDSSQQIIPLSGFRRPKSMVFLSLYPVDNDNFQLLRISLEKLQLSDSSFTIKPHHSLALGKGFLCGFLGLLHADIVRERLDREFNLQVVATAPTVEYHLQVKNGQSQLINSPDDYPDPADIHSISEPIMFVKIYSPKDFLGAIMQLVKDRRGEYLDLKYLANQVQLEYLLPLSEMITDFFDLLKSVSSGYASLDYEFYEYRKTDAVRLDVYVNRTKADAFSQIIVREKAIHKGIELTEKLKKLIPRHQFQIPIQAAIGGKIIARSDIPSFRKDVTQKLYGGDRTRKDKLLETQKKGKKKLRLMGKVSIPQDVFLKVFS